MGLEPMGLEPMGVMTELNLSRYFMVDTQTDYIPLLSMIKLPGTKEARLWDGSGRFSK